MSVIPKNWMLLDNQSTVDVFYNWDLIENIQAVDHRMYIHFSAGARWTDQQGDLPGYGRVWYCELTSFLFVMLQSRLLGTF